MPTRGLVRPFLALFSLLFSLFAVQAFADSHVRIVRLSTVDGSVQIDRAVGSGFEKALPNLPITQGAKLRAHGEGRAEIEFEDGSTLRLVDGAAVEFPQLLLRDSGARATTVEVKGGTTYVNFGAKNNDEFAVVFAQQTAHMTLPVHFRLEIKDDDTAVLSVFKGELSVQGPEGTVNISRKQSASFDLAKPGEYKLSKNIEDLPFDEWDKRQDQYHNEYLAGTSTINSPYAYGMSDLAYYGNFFNAPGYGMVWQPFFTDASWNPFMDGAWSWYPGAGYMWISSYPWGWMPYRYGSWAFIPGFGWGWEPGYWNSWAAMPLVTNLPQGFVTPRPPVVVGGVHNTVIVNRGIGLVPTPNANNKLVVRSNSAGLGIPRGSLQNPAEISQRVLQTGSATVRLRPTSPPPMQPAVFPGMSSPGMSSPGMPSPGMSQGSPSFGSGPSSNSSEPIRSGASTGSRGAAPRR